MPLSSLSSSQPVEFKNKLRICEMEEKSNKRPFEELQPDLEGEMPSKSMKAGDEQQVDKVEMTIFVIVQGLY